MLYKQDIEMLDNLIMNNYKGSGINWAWDRLKKEIEELSKTPTNNKSFQSLWYQIDDLVNCETCSEKEKLDGIRLVLDTTRSETKNIL